LSQLHDLKAYVQEVADADLPNAEKIITSASMIVKKAPARSKADFTAKPGPVSGSVHLVARKVSYRGAYEWQWSPDGGKTWQSAPVTLQARTTLTGLPVAVNCLFRFRAVTKGGEGEWGQSVALLVK
jgi:hypothetical protein